MSLVEDMWDPMETAWQLRRTPAGMRTPIPAVGSRVFYRHRHFAAVTSAQVLAVQDLDEQDDHYLWHVIRDDRGGQLRDELGRPTKARTPDPWVTLRLATDWGHLETREARVRGSAGWLPLDWERRLYPLVVDGRLTFRRQMEMSR